MDLSLNIIAGGVSYGRFRSKCYNASLFVVDRIAVNGFVEGFWAGLTFFLRYDSVFFND